MRTRKVLNFYPDDEPAHAELIDYLEGIEGERRRQQALLQMALIGFRVMVKHESGEEAHFRSRNPDISRLLGESSRGLITGTAPVERKVRTRKTKVIEGSSRVIPPKHGEEASSVEEKEASEVITPTRMDHPPVQPIKKQEQEEGESMLDPLALLRQLSEGE